MEGLRWVEEGAVDAETIEGGLELFANFAALPNAADDYFAMILTGLRDLGDGVGHALLSALFVPVDCFEVLKREALSGDDVKS